MADGNNRSAGIHEDLIQRGVSEVFGNNILIKRKTPLGGGCINQCFKLLLSDGAEVFAKENASAHANLFAEEARGLKALANVPGPRIPEVLWNGDDGSRQALILEYIPSSGKHPGFFPAFGKQLADMHRAAISGRFGFDSDNHIGASPQINPWTDSWVEFFIHARLVPQVETAVRQGKLGGSLAKGLERLYGKLPDLLPEPEHPSLIHGDLWGGNFMCGPDGEPVLIDPAVSYSHREADLAMTRLFGGFSGEFYAAYNEEYPLPPDYRERDELYNLYHVLNHVNLFGESYLGGVISTLTRFGCL